MVYIHQLFLCLLKKLVAQLAAKYTGIFVNGYVSAALTTVLAVFGMKSLYKFSEGPIFLLV